MKTVSVPHAKFACLMLICSIFSFTGVSQSNTLSFQNAVLVSGTANQLNAVYRFPFVTNGIDAIITIDSAVNGASVTQIDESGVGYEKAFQPRVKAGNVAGESYVVFSIKLFEAGTNFPKTMSSVSATALDIDGNLSLKEFCEINMNGGSATYMSTTLQINVWQLLGGSIYKARNVAGIEYDEIDTSALSVMYTVTKSNISSFKVKYGSSRLNSSGSAERQNSLYMKAFQYPDQVTLPVQLISFNAILKSNKVNLEWITAAEKNVSHYVVERSNDGSKFKDVAIVFANSNGSTQNVYRFPDAVAESKGIIYYRLRNVDADGSYARSEVKMVRIGQGEQPKLTVFPNPVASQLRITFPSTWQGKKVTIKILNPAGQMVVQESLGAAGQTETIKVAGLCSGNYFIVASSGGETMQQMITKE